MLLDVHEVFIRIQNNLLDLCPLRIMSFGASTPFEPVLRVQVKEVLEHSFEGVIDNIDQIQIDISGMQLIQNDNKEDRIIFFCFTDPFDRPLPFHCLKNEHGELTIALSPVRVGK